MTRASSCRVRGARLVGVPTPAQVGLYQAGLPALRPMASRYSENPCERCPAACCIIDICLNAVDLARLVLLLGVEPARLVRLDPEHDTTVASPVVIEGRAVQMLIRHSHSARLDRDACHLLATPGGEPRCGVYEARPGVCRVFPFRFTTDEGREFAVGSPTLCPREWALRPAVRRAIEAEIVRWRDQRAFADRVVRDWNRSRGDEDAAAFYRYAVERGARKLKLDASSFLAGGRRALGRRLW